ASFEGPDGLTIDTLTNLYVADRFAYIVRKITPVGPDWVVTTIAGTSRVFGGADGTKGDAVFAGPAQLAVDRDGNLFVADPFNESIRKVTHITNDWVTTTVGGLLGPSANPGTNDGVGTDARFQRPMGAAVDRKGILYIADTYNSTIRRGEPLRLSIQLTSMAHQVQISWPLVATGF